MLRPSVAFCPSHHHQQSSYSSPALLRIRRLCDHDRLPEAIHTLDCSRHAGPPDLVDIFYCLLQSCIKLKDVDAGRKIYQKIVGTGYEGNAYLGSHLIRMFATCWSLFEANRVFRCLREPNVFAWNEILLAHVRLGQAKEALGLYNRMRGSAVKPDKHVFVTVLKACASTGNLKQGKIIHKHMTNSNTELDIFISSAVVDMYAKCGDLRMARRVFDNLKVRNMVTWSAIITGYVQHSCSEEALYLFDRMQVIDGLVPDCCILLNVIQACTSIAAAEQGKVINSLIFENGFDLNLVLGNSLIGMYAVCGCLEEVCKVFNMLCSRDLVTWTTIIEANARHRDYKSALDQFELMLLEGLEPDEVVFLCLLSACSQSGLVKEGCKQINLMLEKHCHLLTCEHFNCIVDLLGRLGCLTEAEDLLLTLPFSFNVVGWRTLLSHCRSYGDVELGKQSQSHVARMDRKDASGYVLLSNIYSHASSVLPADLVEERRKSARARKVPGKAVIIINGKVHAFVVADHQCSPLHNEIYTKLNRLTGQVKESGYLPSIDLVLQSSVDNFQDFGRCFSPLEHY